MQERSNNRLEFALARPTRKKRSAFARRGLAGALECKKMEPDVYWIRDIDPLRFAMMPRPRGGEWLEDEVSGWKQMGIGVVVSLLHQYEADELEILEEERMCVSRGIRYHSFPIKDRGTPESAPRFFAPADELAASIKQGSVVAVHCRAGIGRSGLLASSVLLRLGVPASQVFAVLSRARGLSVPDTPAQMEWFHSVVARMHSNNSLEGDAFNTTPDWTTETHVPGAGGIYRRD